VADVSPPRDASSFSYLTLHLAYVGSSVLEKTSEPYDWSADVDTGGTMSLWLWILLGMICFFAASVFVGLFVAVILAKIGREACALVEFELLTGLLPSEAEPMEAVEQHAVSHGSSRSRL